VAIDGGPVSECHSDLLNVTVTTAMPPDDGGGSFGNRSNLLDVSQALLEAYAQVAEVAANQMVPARLGELLKCQPVNAPARPAWSSSFVLRRARVAAAPRRR